MSEDARLIAITERLNELASKNGCYGNDDTPCFQLSDKPSDWCAYCLMQETAKTLAARDQQIASLRERAAKLAENPYGDEVAALGRDQPLAVGKKIAKAIRALQPNGPADV